MGEIQAGSAIGGKYLLLGTLCASGGGGVVWKVKPAEAEASAGKEELALKILKLDPNKPKEVSAERFKREFELFKKVSHPNIAKIYDFGYDPDFDVHYFTSELIRGGDLRRVIDAPIPVIERLLLQALRALEYLRSFGILHLDIKPQNLLLRTEEGVFVASESDEYPDLVLIDFGLANFRPPEKPGGTANYMPPEVVVRRLGLATQTLPAPDHRSDLYSLGVTFYHVLTGVKPFAVTGLDGHLDTDATMRRHLDDDRPPPPSTHNPDVPQYLDSIIMRMMALHLNDRYQAAILAAQALCFRSPNRLEVESRETISAYLPEEGMLIGRHDEKRMIEEAVLQSAEGEGNSIICIAGGWGIGKTRLLKSIKPFAQQQEMEVFTDLKYGSLDFKRPVAFLIDDPFLSTSDTSTISNAFTLRHLIQHISQLPKARCFLAFTLNTDLVKIEDALKVLGVEPALSKVEGPALLKVITLENFSTGEINEYLTHILGEAPSKEIVDELNSITFGNPKYIADVIKRIMEKGELFSYVSGRAGAKTLESLGFSFARAESPPSLAMHFVEVTQNLPSGAQLLASRLACWQRPASIDELFSTIPSLLMGEGEGGGDLATLLSSGLVKRNEDGLFSFTNPLAGKIIEANLGPKNRASIHDSIAVVIARPEGPKQSPEDRAFELSRHLAFGSDPKLQKEAALHFATEALKRLHPAETAELLLAVFNAIPADDWGTRAEALVCEAQAMARLGRWNDAKAEIERLRDLAPPLCDRGRGPAEGGWPRKCPEARAAGRKGREGGVDPTFKLNLRADEQLGLLALRRRDLSEAREIFTKAIDSVKKNFPLLCKEGIGEVDPSTTVQTLRLENYLAAVDLREGKYEAAAETYRCTAEAAAKLPDEFRMKITNNELGETLVLMEKPKEAMSILESELEGVKKADHREHVANRLRILGDAYRRMGDFSSAQQYYQDALDYSHKYHLFEYQLRIRNSFANLLLQTSKWSMVIEQLKPALNLAMQLEGKATSVDIMVNIGLAYNRLGRFDDAIEYLELALDFAKTPEAESSAQMRNFVPIIQVTLGHAHYEKGQYREAEKHLKTALDYDRQKPLSNLLRYRLYGTLAEVYLALGKPRNSKKLLPTLEEISREVPEAQEHLKQLTLQIEKALKC